MERRAEFNTITRLELSEEELKHLYTIMALIQYPYDCNLDYREETIIRRLRNDFQRFNSAITKACECDPNNLALNQIRMFMQRHYGNVKRFVRDLPHEEVLG